MVVKDTESITIPLNMVIQTAYVPLVRSVRYTQVISE